MCVGQVAAGGSEALSIRLVPEERTKRSKEELRQLWRKAILQQILLQRMERENQKLQGELCKICYVLIHKSVENESSHYAYNSLFFRLVSQIELYDLNVCQAPEGKTAKHPKCKGTQSRDNQLLLS